MKRAPCPGPAPALCPVQWTQPTTWVGLETKGSSPAPVEQHGKLAPVWGFYEMEISGDRLVGFWLTVLSLLSAPAYLERLFLLLYFSSRTEINVYFACTMTSHQRQAIKKSNHFAFILSGS